MRQTFTISIILLLFSFISCQSQTSIKFITDSEISVVNSFDKLSKAHKIILDRSSAECTPLSLCITFLDANSGQPIPGSNIYIYHADLDGEYYPEDPRDNSTAKYNGSATTDDDGKVFLQTILPGDYGSGEDNRHIHIKVAGAKPEAYDIFFNQYLSTFFKRTIETNDQLFLVDLKQNQDGELYGILDINVKIGGD